MRIRVATCGGLACLVALVGSCGDPPRPSPSVAPAPGASEAPPAPGAAAPLAPGASSSAPSVRPPCEQVAHALVAGRDVSLCLEHVAEDDSDGPSVSMRVEDGEGRVLLSDGWLMPFSRRLADGPQAVFGDATGDGVPDLLVSAPAAGLESPLSCRYVVDGAELRPRGDDDSTSALSLPHSFAAALSRDAGDWAPPAGARETITVKEACAIVSGSRTLSGFRRHATADAELVDYREPGRPYCAARAARRGVTHARLAELDRAPCGSMTCEKGIAVCRDHEPDPSAQYYLFVKGSDGRFKLKAVALYRGT